MKTTEFCTLKVGSKIRHWSGGPVYTVIANHNGLVTAALFARIEVVGAGLPHEHYPYDIVYSGDMPDRLDDE